MSQVDPFNEVFPKMTKCDFYMHSVAGEIDVSGWRSREEVVEM